MGLICILFIFDMSFDIFQLSPPKWRYCVRIENLGETAVQLRERHWQIYSIPGILESIRGRGVVGEVSRPCTGRRKFESLI